MSHLPGLLEKLYAHVSPYEAEHIAGKNVLVTGAGGSIGTALCQRLIRLLPKSLVCLDMYDGNLYELRHKLQADPSVQLADVLYVLGDVRDPGGMTAVMKKSKPDIVFHAAALKHVPMLEEPLNMIEAARTNVIGTFNVLRACADQPDCLMVNVSTDKAVEPSSILGLTKRCAELQVRLGPHEFGVRAVTVRFGNVLDSFGSVVPLFRRQIAVNGPLTITHPDMTRYFMTLEQATSLMIRATGPEMLDAADRCGSGLFVLDMGGPIRVEDLARALAEQSGVPDIGVEYIGIRPGEKLHEKLWVSGEYTNSQDNWDGVMVGRHQADLPDAYQIDQLHTAITGRYLNLAKRLMCRLVPEYTGSFEA